MLTVVRTARAAAVVVGVLMATFGAAASPVPATAPVAASPPQVPRIVLVDDTVELGDALKSRTPPHDMPVRVAAFALPDDNPSTVRLLVAGDVDQRQERNGRASIAYTVTDEGGKPIAQVFKRLELRCTPAGTLAFSDAVSVPPGTYRLRFAALRNGRTGTAEETLAARLQHAASLRLGDVLIGDTPGNDAAASVTADRRVQGDRLVATLPIGVDGPLPADVAIALEVGRSASGVAMLSSTVPIVPGDGQARLAQAEIDLHVLPPGAYTVRLVVSIGGSPVARLSAPFSLERATGGSAPAPRTAPSPARAGAPSATTPTNVIFRFEDVLDPAVLGPLLDDLAAHGSEGMRPAVEQAKAGRFADAAQSIATTDASDPVRPFLLGLSLLADRKLQAASEAFADASRAAPDSFVAMFYIGACYAAGGRDDQAVSAWQTSLIGLDRYPVVFRLVGEALSRMGQPARALPILTEAVSRWPDNRPLRLRLVRVALDAWRYDDALEVVEAGLARKPADTDLLLAGMQVLFERVSQRGDPRPADARVRVTRYYDAYVAAGGSQQSLAAEWVAFITKKASAGKHGA
jgi:hypothetical protein